MRLVLNGRDADLADGASVRELLESLGLGAGGVAVELNREILKKDLFPSTLLKEGDRVEIVHFVGGG
jgi:thiamine biosynthesis protein ThiS